jgi:large subunit ribosomal protein L24
MARINPKLIETSKHQRDKMIGARLDDALRGQYKKRSVRVIKGDSVKVVRGEYKGVEGKIEKVITEQGTLHIEGISREKIKGGQAKVPIHASNVMVTVLNLSDKLRSNRLQEGGSRPEAPEKEDKKRETTTEKGAESRE